jgi:hypothetical protein
MSNIFKEQMLEYISETVGELWQLETRPDLEKDCLEYVLDQFNSNEELSKDDDFIKYLMIKFLSDHCRDAVSSQDLDYMAKQQQGNDI